MVRNSLPYEVVQPCYMYKGGDTTSHNEASLGLSTIPLRDDFDT